MPGVGDPKQQVCYQALAAPSIGFSNLSHFDSRNNTLSSNRVPIINVLTCGEDTSKPHDA